MELVIVQGNFNLPFGFVTWNYHRGMRCESFGMVSQDHDTKYSVHY